MLRKKNKRLRIAIIVEPFPCTSQTFVLNHITAMMDLGHQVDIFAFGRSQESQVVHQSVKAYKLDKHVTYIFPLPQGKKPRQRKFIGILLRNLFRHPVWIYRCLRMRKFEWLKPIDLLFLAGYFMKRRYDVIHCHFGTAARTMCFLKSILRRVKYVVTFHGYDIRKGLKEQDNYYQALFEKADWVVAICEYNKQKLQELKCPVSKIVSIPNIIDTRLFSRGQRTDRDIFVIATVARLVDEKNHEFALRIIQALRDTHSSPFKYVIIGDGPLKEELVSAVKQYQLESHVEFKGALRQEEVKAVLDQSDLFLLTSRHEVLPTVILEAQSMGIPVVASDIGGVREAMVDGQSGFVIPLDDVETAKDRIIRLMKDAKLREEFGQAGKRFIREHFDVHEISRKLVKIYEH